MTYSKESQRDLEDLRREGEEPEPYDPQLQSELDAHFSKQINPVEVGGVQVGLHNSHSDVLGPCVDVRINTHTAVEIESKKDWRFLNMPTTCPYPIRSKLNTYLQVSSMMAECKRTWGQCEYRITENLVQVGLVNHESRPPSIYVYYDSEPLMRISIAGTEIFQKEGEE